MIKDQGSGEAQANGDLPLMIRTMLFSVSDLILWEDPDNQDRTMRLLESIEGVVLDIGSDGLHAVVVMMGQNNEF